MDTEFPINKILIWDYDLKENYNSEEFKRWYISRVLSCGTKDDIRQVGTNVIKRYFPELNLPAGIKKFWKWYFGYANSN